MWMWSWFVKEITFNWELCICVVADSTVLAYVLSELNRRHDYGLDLFLLSVDEGITGYRDDSLETVKRNEIQVWFCLWTVVLLAKFPLSFSGTSVFEYMFFFSFAMYFFLIEARSLILYVKSWKLKENN